MAKVAFDGVTGKVAFDEFGDTTTKVLTVYKVKGGKWVAVEDRRPSSPSDLGHVAPVQTAGVVHRTTPAVRIWWPRRPWPGNARTAAAVWCGTPRRRSRYAPPSL